MIKPNSWIMLQDSENEERAKTGMVVYDCHSFDYGLARDDTMFTGIPHVSVTLDPNGDYPFFTVPAEHLGKRDDD